MRRFAEIVLTLFVLLLLAPVFIIICTLIVCTSPGNPFFAQTRVGKNGKHFQIYKFRKMDIQEPENGVGVTVLSDRRLNRVGRWLERFKLDELPQFFNVLQGDMAYIGPRPEIPKFVEYYKDKWSIVHSVKPGVLGYAQTICSHEGELYPPNCTDPESFYLQQILPAKLDAEISYVQSKRFWRDLSIFIRVSAKFLIKSVRLSLKRIRPNFSSADHRNEMVQAK